MAQTHLVAAVAALLRQAKPLLTTAAELEAMEAMAPLLAFLAAASHMPVAEAVHLTLHPAPAVQVAQEAVALVVGVEAAQREPRIQAVEVAAAFLGVTAAQAAPASLSSSTTSALPQSSPSSHRRSGLHQRVR
jgi:hypothetical protein